MQKRIISFLIVGLLFLLLNFNFFKELSWSFISEVKIKDLNGFKIINNDYIAILEIPKINLKKGLYAKDNKYNDVKYGIQILDKSNENLVILASHSGNSLISYFKNLAKLKVDDKVIIKYQEKDYIYQVRYFYEIEKNGKLEILDDNIYKKIILITCNNQSKQIVYVGELLT